VTTPSPAWDRAAAAVREEGGIALHRGWAIRSTPAEIGRVFVEVAVHSGGDPAPTDAEAGELAPHYVGEVIGMLLAFAHESGAELAELLAEALRYRKDAIS
jgi:hypothetical protein